MNPLYLFSRHMTPVKKLLLMKAAAGGEPLNEYTETGNPLSFETNVAKPLKSLLIPWTPSQSGSGDPSPENVRPISGVSAVNVWQTGANLIDDTKRYQQYAGYSLYIGSTGTTYDYFLKSGTYTFSAEMFNGASYDMYYRKSDGQAVYIWKSTYGVTSASFTLTEDGYYRFNFGGAMKENVGRCWLNYGAMASEYAPYNGTTFNVVFPDETGTVYGGSLDLTTGVLTVTWAAFKVSNDTVFNTSIANPLTFLRINLDNNVALPVLPRTDNNNRGERSDKMPWVAMRTENKFGAAIGYYDLGTFYNSIYIFNTNLADPSVQTAQDCIDYIKSIAPTFVYPIANPVTYQLTPEQITTLIGDNVIWSDTNGTNTVKYLKKG